MPDYTNYTNYAYYIRYTNNPDNEYTVYAAGSDRAFEWCEAKVAANVDKSQETWERITLSEAEGRCFRLFGIGVDADPFVEMSINLDGPEEQIERSAAALDFALERDERAALDEAEFEAWEQELKRALREAQARAEAARSGGGALGDTLRRKYYYIRCARNRPDNEYTYYDLFDPKRINAADPGSEYTIYVAGTERAFEWCEARVVDEWCEDQVAANVDKSQGTWKRITRREAEDYHRHLFGIDASEPLRNDPVDRRIDLAERINRSAAALDSYIEEQEQYERAKAEAKNGAELSAPASIVEAA